MHVTVSELHVYPVKSMRGIALSTARLTALGLEHDRRWMVVREDGRFVTQREMNRMALVQPALDGSGLSLSMAGHDAVRVPPEPSGKPLRTAVWDDDCEVVSAGAAVSDWLSECLQSPVRLHLSAMAPGFVRPQSQAERMGAGTRTVFADASPYLVASQDSLDALNQELSARSLPPVRMDRFRPNIVVRGLPAFDEHRVATLASARFGLRLRDRCERCVLTTIDPSTAVPDPAGQPFRTLVEINPVPGKTRSPAFAENATLEHGEGAEVRRGEALDVRYRTA